MSTVKAFTQAAAVKLRSVLLLISVTNCGSSSRIYSDFPKLPQGGNGTLYEHETCVLSFENDGAGNAEARATFEAIRAIADPHSALQFEITLCLPEGSESFSSAQNAVEGRRTFILPAGEAFRFGKFSNLDQIEAIYGDLGLLLDLDVREGADD